MDRIDPAELFPAGAPARRRPIDVRAPAEVARGAVPGAVVLPILTDAERHAVGIRYKQRGQAAAVELGRELTEPHLTARVAAWRAACAQQPSAVMCWRGGMRSELAQRFIGRDDVPRVRGGYRAVRRHLVGALERAAAERAVLVVSGLTGSGKTEWLTALRAGAAPDEVLPLDLEGAARHRGSAFGARDDLGGADGEGSVQPAQQTFEHRLALDVLPSAASTLLLEDESRAIGRVHLPAPLYARVAAAPLLILEDDLGGRVRRIHREYILEPTARHGAAAVRARLIAALDRIRPRIGNDAADRIGARFRALAESDDWYDPVACGSAIEPLLLEYYDPLYQKAIRRRARPVLARGSQEALTEWLTRHAPNLASG